MAEIDPWGAQELKANKELIKQFGLGEFSEPQRKKFKHYFFKRKIIQAHRDFHFIEKAIDEKKPFIQLTGIASSGKLHLGHKADIDLFKYFSSFKSKSHFAICDLDGYLSRPDEKVASLEKAQQIAVENAAHALALGLEKKQLYVQTQKPARYYSFAFELSKKMTENTFRAIYGHLDLGKLSANFLQYADILHYQLKEFDGIMPSLTCIGLDQEPHARATRDLVKRLPYKMFTPSFIYFAHQGGLKEGLKMSSSQPETAIFLDDSIEEMKKKIAHAFSGGRETLDMHRKLGGMPEKDKSFEILLFHHPDSKFVEKVFQEYKSGNMLTGELKGITVDFLSKFLKQHQAKFSKNKKIAEKIVFG